MKMRRLNSEEQEDEINNKNKKAEKTEKGNMYKGKLIGKEIVSESRGEVVCQVALARMRATLTTLKQHKKKIVISVSDDGLLIQDEKQEEEIAKYLPDQISFVARDPYDSRTFGCIVTSVPPKQNFFHYVGFRVEKQIEHLLANLRKCLQLNLENKNNEKTEASDSVDKEKKSTPENETRNIVESSTAETQETGNDKPPEILDTNKQETSLLDFNENSSELGDPFKQGSNIGSMTLQMSNMNMTSSENMTGTSSWIRFNDPFSPTNTTAPNIPFPQIIPPPCAANKQTQNSISENNAFNKTYETKPSTLLQNQNFASNSKNFPNQGPPFTSEQSLNPFHCQPSLTPYQNQVQSPNNQNSTQIPNPSNYHQNLQIAAQSNAFGGAPILRSFSSHVFDASSLGVALGGTSTQQGGHYTANNTPQNYFPPGANNSNRAQFEFGGNTAPTLISSARVSSVSSGSFFDPSGGNLTAGMTHHRPNNDALDDLSVTWPGTMLVNEKKLFADVEQQNDQRNLLASQSWSQLSNDLPDQKLHPNNPFK